MASEINLAILDQYFTAIPVQLTPEKLQTTLRAIARFRGILQRSEVQITFFGAFKAGKSTLLNAIIGWPLLPSRTNRATGVVTKIGYGEQLAAFVVRNSGRQEAIFFDDLPRYILLDLQETEARAPQNVAEVHIRIPFDFLRGRGVLADSPGLMDNQALTTRTAAELENTDLAVMVLSADKLVSQAEREIALQAHSLLGGNLVFIVNRLDLIDADEREEVLDWASSAFKGLGNSIVGQPRIFATEAKATLEARKKSGHSGTAGNSLLDFEQWLLTLLDGPRGRQMHLLSRLSLLLHKLGWAKTVLENGIAETQQKLLSLHKQADQERQLRQMAFKQDVVANRERLQQFRNRLEGLGVRFLEDCTWNLQKVVQSDRDISRHLHEVFEPALQIYSRNVYQGVRASITFTEFRIPAFGLRPRDWQAQTERNLKDTVNGWLNQTFGQNVSSTAATMGDWFNKNVLGNDERNKKVVAVEETARQIMPSLREEAEIYVQKIDNLLVEFERNWQVPGAKSSELEGHERTLKTYQELLKWCNDFQAAVKYLQQQLTQG